MRALVVFFFFSPWWVKKRVSPFLLPATGPSCCGRLEFGLASRRKEEDSVCLLAVGLYFRTTWARRAGRIVWPEGNNAFIPAVSGLVFTVFFAGVNNIPFLDGTSDFSFAFGSKTQWYTWGKRRKVASEKGFRWIFSYRAPYRLVIFSVGRKRNRLTMCSRNWRGLVGSNFQILINSVHKPISLSVNNKCLKSYP